MRKRLNKLLRRLGYELNIYQGEPGYDDSCVSLKTEGDPKGNVLIAFIIEPFLVKDESSISSTHQHDLVSFIMAKVFLQYGYNVDVIDYRNDQFVPDKKYTFFVSARTNLEKIKRRLNEDCTVIAHLDTAHYLFNNMAAYQRLLDVQRRRKVTIVGRKNVEHNLAIEHADFATVMGNRFTVDTYRYAGKPLYPLWGTSRHQYPWNDAKDFERCRNRFLWLGSSGMVHKGLDLVLEAFTSMPDLHLTVCGPVNKERQFEQAYEKELYHTSNIHTVGWVDIGSDEFLKIAADNVALIYPSCAEGKSGAALTCMQAGLIPILSYESGVDVEDFGIILENCSVETITSTITMVAKLPTRELAQRAKKTWQHARKYHTGEKLEEQYREIIGEIIERIR
ncbi:MAG TPA: glycosyltransferase family 1 protein [Gammaproteobacteria bacterium]|nr:glycosyltransferase family 1 protein [Gammaproteobacteria bacterium]